jgi:hypothetical protein
MTTGSCACYHYFIIIDLFHFLGSLSVALVETVAKKLVMRQGHFSAGNQVHPLVLSPRTIAKCQAWHGMFHVFDGVRTRTAEKHS